MYGRSPLLQKIKDARESGYSGAPDNSEDLAKDGLGRMY
jgi:hypothetical protein